MQKLKPVLAWLVAQRWFPTLTRPLLAGALATGIVLALHKLGLNVLPGEVETAVSPLVGLLIGAVVEQGKSSTQIGHVTVTSVVVSPDDLATKVAQAVQRTPTQMPASTDAPHITQ